MMHLSGNPLEMAKAESGISCLYSREDTTNYINGLKVNHD